LKKEKRVLKIFLFNDQFFNSKIDLENILNDHFSAKYDVIVDDIEGEIALKNKIKENNINVVLFDLIIKNEFHEKFFKLKSKNKNLIIGFLSDGKNPNDSLIQFESYFDFMIKKPFLNKEIPLVFERFIKKIINQKSDRNKKIEVYGNILDHLNKGYMVFNKEGYIIKSSEKFIKDFFDINVEGKKIQDVLRLNEESHIVFKNWLKNVWGKLLPFDDILPFAPQSYQKKQNKYITLNYIPFFDEKNNVDSVMCVATDKSKERKNEFIAKEGKEYSEMLVEIFNRPEEFIELIENCKHNFNVKVNYGLVDMNFYFQVIKKIRLELDDFKCSSLAIPLEQLEYIAESYQEEVFDFNEMPNDLNNSISNAEKSVNEFLKKYEIIASQIKQKNELIKNSIELKKLVDKIGEYSSILEVQVEEKTRFLKDALDKISKQSFEKDKLVKNQQEFMASLGHEFRTPMNAILGFLELLKDSLEIEKWEKSGDISNFIDSIRKASYSLLALIENIMDFSKIDAGKIKLHYKIENVESILKESIDLFLYESQRKNISLNLNFPHNFPKYLMFDSGKLRQILNNLLGNALKFTEKGRVDLNVDFDIKNNKEKIISKTKILFDNKIFKFEEKIRFIIKVNDTGKGIPKEQLKDIFLPFEQVEGQRFDNYGGTGLGLTITKGLVNVLNGSIEVKSEIDKGSSFKIIFENVEKYELLEQNKKIENKKDRSDHELIKFKNHNVGIVVNLDLERNLLTNYLGSFALNCIFFDDGRDIVNKLKEKKIDLLISELYLPHLNGFEISEQRKMDPETSEIPLICLSTTDPFDERKNKNKDIDVEKIYSSFQSILIKPISKKEFIFEISKFLPHDVVEGETGEISVNKKNNMNETPLDEIENINELSKELGTEIENTYQQIMTGVFSIQEIDMFGDRIISLAKKHRYKELEEWGMGIKIMADQFDMEAIKNELPDLKDLFSYIKRK
jgi:signal transduction histidine kinase/CheY-like chemotaxis protein